MVGLGLHGFGAGDALAQGFKHGRGGALVGGKEALGGFGIKRCRGGVRTEIREIPAGFAEVLVAGGALLAVPSAARHQDDSGQQAEALDGQGDMGQIGDGAVPILKIKGVKELLAR